MKSALKLSGIISTALFLAACSSVEEVSVQDIKPTPKYVYEEVKIDSNLKIKEVVDQNDLQSCVAYAAYLSDIGEHKKSARVYLDISKRFSNSKLTKDCTLEAFRQMYLAGEVEACRKLLEEIDDERHLYSSYKNKEIKLFREFLYQEDLAK